MRELSLNVMDIVQNSISANATLIKIIITEDTDTNLLSIEIKDNGKGMTTEQVKNVQDPFYTTRKTRKVGLGVPLFKMAALQTEGSFNITSQIGSGTIVTAVFNTSHVDMTPLGDINDTISLLIHCNPNIDFIFNHTVNGKGFTLNTCEIRDVLGSDVPLNSPDVAGWIRDYLKEGNESIFGGAANP